MVPRQEPGRHLPDRPVDRHARRARPSRSTRDHLSRQRRDGPVRDARRSPLRRHADHRRAVARTDPRGRRRDSHRDPIGRRLRPHAAAIPGGRRRRRVGDRGDRDTAQRGRRVAAPRYRAGTGRSFGSAATHVPRRTSCSPTLLRNGRRGRSRRNAVRRSCIARSAANWLRTWVFIRLCTSVNSPLSRPW